jgi:hypothetical protein
LTKEAYAKKGKGARRRALAKVTAATVKKSDAPLPAVPAGPGKSEIRRGVRQRNAARRARLRAEKKERQGK